MVYITDEANREIYNMSLGEYSRLLPSSAGLGNLGFAFTELSADATDEEKRDVLSKRFDMIKQKLMLQLKSLVPKANWTIARIM